MITVGPNSTATGLSNLWCGKERNLIQCKTAQLWYRTAIGQFWGQALLGPDSSALCRSALCCTALLCSIHLWPALCSSKTSLVFSSAKETQSWWRESYTFRTREELAYIDRSPHPWLLIHLSSCKWGLHILPVWLVQKALPSWSE